MPIQVVVAQDFDHISELAFDVLRDDLTARLKTQSEFVLGLATGNSPVGLYKHLARAVNRGKIDARRIRSFNLDEYVGLSGADAQERTLHSASYSYFMCQELFGLLATKFAQTNVPGGPLIDQDKLIAEMNAHPDDWREQGGDSGRAIVIRRDAKSDYLAWLRRNVLDYYTKKIRAAGGIDLQVIGVGGRGHVAFHEAGIPLSTTGTLLVKLDENTVCNAVADGNFESVTGVPRFAVSMGAKLVFKAKTVLLLAAGQRKVEPITRALLDKPSADLPMSYGQKYAAAGGNLVCVVDEIVGGELLAHRKTLREKGVTFVDRRRSRAKTAVRDILFFRDTQSGAYRCR